jgi:hypothetical protein
MSKHFIDKNVFRGEMLQIKIRPFACLASIIALQQARQLESHGELETTTSFTLAQSVRQSTSAVDSILDACQLGGGWGHILESGGASSASAVSSVDNESRTENPSPPPMQQRMKHGWASASSAQQKNEST